MPDKTNKELALEVQELRQFALAAMLTIPMTQNTRDHWWEKLGGYRDVREDEQLDSTNL